MPEIVGRLRPPRLSAAPASPANGEIYFDTGGSLPAWYNGSAWVAFNAIPTLSSTPPTGPSNGQLWAMSPSAGVVWVFRYNSGSASSFKWEFVGGIPYSAAIDGAEGITAVTNAWTDATTTGPTIVAPRPGDYWITFSMQCYHSASAQTHGGVCVSVNGAAPAATWLTAFTITGWASTLVGTATGQGWYSNMPASANIYLRYQQAATGLVVRGRSISVTPYRVS